MISSYRSHFEFQPELVYLNSAYASPMPTRAAAAGRHAIDQRTTKFWTLGQEDFFIATEQLRMLVGALWQVYPRNIAIVPSVSYGVETAVKNLRLEPKQAILVPEADFPSNIYPWLEAAKQSEAVVKTVKKLPDCDWTESFVEAINKKTKIVSVPLCDWSDGTKFDLREISAYCKKFGAALVVDISQAFGAVPIHLEEFDPDFVFSVGYKWQLGPYGLSYLYVADRHLEGKPLENGWLNRRASEDFTRLSEYTEYYQDGARRFDAGQRSQFHLTPMAIESMRLLKEVSIAKIHDHVSALSQELRRGLTKLGFEVPDTKTLLGHLTGARNKAFPDMGSLARRLKERNIHVSARGSALRVSPHLYNSNDDVQKLLEGLKQELATGIKWTRPAAEPSL